MKMMLTMMAAVLAASSVALADGPVENPAPAAKPGDLLDGALGPPSTPALDPNTAARHDANDLINDLTNGKKEEPASKDAGKMLEDFVAHTRDAGANLKNNKDPGVETQDHQRRAMIAMDGLIELVKEQQKKQQSQGQSQGQQKQQNPGQGQGKGPHADTGNDAAQNSELPGGGVNAFKGNNDIIAKGPTEWGNLPQKERDLIVNSLQDGALKSYQDKIRKYYEALAEIGRNK